MGPGRGVAVGGSAVLIIALIMLCMGADPRQIQQLLQNVPQVPAGPGEGQVERPETAEETRSREFTATILGFTEEVWDEQFRLAGQRYEPPQMVLFAEQVTTGCGTAPSAVGPFYCPADKTVYLDPTFFEELEQKLGGSKAEFSQAYVIAHEVGHHIQNLLGYSSLVQNKQRAACPKRKGTSGRCGSSCRPTTWPASGPIMARRSTVSSNLAISKRQLPRPTPSATIGCSGDRQGSSPPRVSRTARRINAFAGSARD